MNPEKLAKMAAQVRTGGKGSVRRKKKAVHKTTTTDDKRLQTTLKRLGVNNIPAIEEARYAQCRTAHNLARWPRVPASVSKSAGSSSNALPASSAVPHPPQSPQPGLRGRGGCAPRLRRRPPTGVELEGAARAPSSPRA